MMNPKYTRRETAMGFEGETSYWPCGCETWFCGGSYCSKHRKLGNPEDDYPIEEK